MEDAVFFRCNGPPPRILSGRRALTTGPARLTRAPFCRAAITVTNACDSSSQAGTTALGADRSLPGT
jgi:hypothetical protein